LAQDIRSLAQGVKRPPTVNCVEAAPRKSLGQPSLFTNEALQGSPSVSDLAAAVPEAHRPDMLHQRRLPSYDMEKTKATVALLSARMSPRKTGHIPRLPLHATQPTKLGIQEDHNNLSACSTNDSIEGQLTRQWSQGKVIANVAVSQPSRGIDILCQDASGQTVTSKTRAALPLFEPVASKPLQALATPIGGRAAAYLKPLPFPGFAEGPNALLAPSPRRLTVSQAAVQHPVFLSFPGTPLVSPRGFVPPSPRG